MRLLKYLTLAVFFMAIFPFNLFGSNADTYEKMWKKVEEAVEEGLPQTAIKELEPIIQKAKQEKDIVWSLKAICQKIIMEGEVQGNLPEEKIKRFEEVISTEDESLKPMLKVILAKWYYFYYERNRYRFLRRSQTVALDSKDFKTWDLPKLFAHIGSLYDAVLANEEELAKIPLSKFDGFLEEGNQPVELRSNLFEFFVHDALEFYQSDDQSTAKPQNAFELDADSDVFAKAETFVKWEPETTDKESSTYKALQLFKRLLSLNIATNNTNALIVNDLERLSWAKRNAKGPDKTDNYRKALNAIINEFPENLYTANAMYELALSYQQSGDFIKALELAERASSKWPKSYGGKLSLNIISEIKRPSIYYNTERLLKPGTNKISINFKNLTHAYFKIIKRTDEEIIKGKYSVDALDNDESKAIAAKPADFKFDTELNPGIEYKNQTKEIDIPNLEKGYYWLVSSTKPDFSLEENILHIGAIVVSDLTVLARDGQNNGNNDVFVLDAVSGKPIKGATVKLYEHEYNKGYKETKSGKSDKDGKISFSASGRTSLLTAKTNDDKVYAELSLYNYKEMTPNARHELYFFTDRAIYRPGQTVYFKAIAINSSETKNTYSVIPNKEIKVVLNDPNNKPVKELTLTTNEFGSCTGTFITPTDRLTGSYSLYCPNFSSRSRVLVEEYKRPKFQVSMESPEESFQLDQTVKVKGKAMAYTGAAIDNAEVTYRVKRRARYPYWCWWCFAPSDAQEISNGTVKTNEKGEFEISFIAKPDRSLDKANDPTFTFEITADVTDNTGETRSCNTSVTFGYTAIRVLISANSKFDAEKPCNISFITETHNDKPIKSAGRYQIIELVQPEKPFRYAYSGSKVSDENTAIREMSEGKVVFEDNFETDDKGTFKKEFNLPEGVYRIKATSTDKFGAEVKTQTEIMGINANAERMSLKFPFFFNTTSKNLKPGDTYKGYWATGYNEGPAYIEIKHRNKVLKAFWTDEGKNKQFIEYPVSEDMRGGFIIKVFMVKENRLYEKREHVDVSWSNKVLNVKLVHFNSKMEPASKESWKLEVSGEDAEKNTIEMLASMYDASLDAYASHYWPYIGHFYSDSENVNNKFINSKADLDLFKNTFEHNYHNVYIEYPSFPDNVVRDFYGYSHARMYKNNMRGAGAMPMMLSKSAGAPVVMMESNACQAMDDCCVESCAAPMENDAMEEEVNERKSSVTSSEGSTTEEDLDLSKVTARTNLNETAFFYPQLTLSNEGTVTIDFEMPEALTTWKFMAYAHGTKLQEGRLSQEVVTQKELMVQPNAPRFLREGDKLEFTVKVTNLSDTEQSGQVSLEFLDAITDASRNEEFKNVESKKSFTIPAGQSKGISWKIDVPLKPGFVKYKAVGATSTNSDGEEGMLPILSSRILVTESLPLPIRGPETKDFKFQKLIDSANSETLENKGLTVEVTSNPAWYAVQALPYLIEFPHECSEQTFNRIYANKLAQHIANSDPKIRNVFNIWLKDEQYNNGTALKSNLEKNQHLKSVTLMETPWVLDAENENEQKHHIGVLFEEARLEKEIEAATNKLREMQLGDGSFPWFPGGIGNPFITNYIMCGYGRMRHLGTDIDLTIALRCVDFMDKEIVRWYNEILKIKDYKNYTHINSTVAFYLYGRSFFLKDKKVPSSSQAAVNFFIEEAKKNWLKVSSRMSQAHIALALQRFGDKETPAKIVKSIKERSVTDEEMGRFWREDEISFSWNRADIETQAMMIELFSEITNDEEAVEDCKVWLLKQKQTQAWKTTKSTADAIYSLILKGADLLASDKLVTVTLNGNEVKPEKVEVGTGYYQKIYAGGEVKADMGNIQLKKEDKGVAWGAVHWQYIEDMSKITPYENNLKLKKTLFIKKNTEKGPIISPVENGSLRVGDLVVVRIELNTDRDMEFVHMKDQRGSGMEPVNVISRYKWQDGLGYYEATKDAATHFYIDYLPKGTYVFEYELRVQLAGEYQTGMAEIMCMYAPEFNSHSESFKLNVEGLK